MISLPSEALFLGITYRGLRYRLPTATSTRLSAERLASFRSSTPRSDYLTQTKQVYQIRPSNRFATPQARSERTKAEAKLRLQALDFQPSALLPPEAAAGYLKNTDFHILIFTYLHKLCQSVPNILVKNTC